MYVLLCVTAVSIALYIFLRKCQRKGKPIPGPTCLPVVGYAFNLQRGMIQPFFKLAESYGDIFKITVFGQNMVVVNNAEMIRSMFCADPYKRYTNDRVETFVGKYVVYDSKTITLTANAFNSPHGDLRKAFTRGMHVYGDGIKDFETKIQAQLMKLIKEIEMKGGKEFDMQESLLKSLCNVMSIFLNGEDLENELKDSNIYWELIDLWDFFMRPDVEPVMATFPFLRYVPGVFKKSFDRVMQLRDKILKRHIFDAKTSYQPGAVRGLIDFFLAEQSNAEKEGRPVLFTDERICALFIELNGAGIVTSFCTLTSVFMCLLNHPEYQTRIQEEIDRVVDKQELPTLSHREDCVFLEAVVLEATRLMPAVPLLIPHYCRPHMEFQGYDVPANSMLCLNESLYQQLLKVQKSVLPSAMLEMYSQIFANVWYIHHDKRIWGDPWTFRPERWLDADGHLLPQDHTLRKNWLPFGTGRRQCIGESFARSRLFLFISTLLQRWTFEMTPEHAVPCDPRAGHITVDLTCRPKPYLCRAIPRK